MRARLDTPLCHLYGLSEDEASYELDQFPAVGKNERKQFGKYFTKQLTLGHYKALATGDTESEIEKSKAQQEQQENDVESTVQFHRTFQGPEKNHSI